MCTPQADVLWAAIECDDGGLRSCVTDVEVRCGAPLHGCNDANEFYELFHVVGWALCRKGVVGWVM